MTTNRSKRTWYGMFSFILVVALMVCGSVTQGVYAAPNTPNPLILHEPAGSDSVDDSNIANKEQNPLTPPTPTLTVTLQDEAGAPIAGVGLSVIAADFTGRQKDSATTDKNGKAVFTRLKSGAYYLWANINALRRHDGYGLPAMIREFKSATSYYMSESRTFDLSQNVESTYIVKKNNYIWFETYLQVVRSGKIILMNTKMGCQQIIPVASTDYLQIYMPMRNLYKIVTIKDNDYDSWILEFWAHERLRIELL